MCARAGCLGGAEPCCAARFSPRRSWISLIVVLVAATLPLYVSGYVLGLLTIAYYFGVFSMAWDLLFGFANEVNFGPTFLIGLGAYTAGILDNLYQPPICALRRGGRAGGDDRRRSCWRCRRCGCAAPISA